VEYILTTMNEELLAASALLVQSGALLVSVNSSLLKGTVSRDFLLLVFS
jgi:hypothetical protein